MYLFFFFQAEDGIRDGHVTGVQTCALPILTGYFHLSRVLVVPGDTVDVGQVIGRVGSSGRVTRSHLHWFAAYGGITVDPLDLVRPNGPMRPTPAPPPPRR